MIQRFKKYNIDMDVLKDLYYGERLSVDRISERMEISRHIIYGVMREYGLERRSRGEAQKCRVDRSHHDISIEELVRLYFDEKKPLSVIVEELGVSSQFIRSRLLKAGYKLRTRGQARLLQRGGRSVIVFSESQREEIRRLYCEEGSALSTIAFKYSVSPQIIRRELLLMGISLRTAKEAQELRRNKEYERICSEISDNSGVVLPASEVSSARILELYLVEKLKIQEVALKCSLSTVEVYSVLQRAGHLPIV